jgi:hypothetical protein
MSRHVGASLAVALLLAAGGCSPLQSFLVSLNGPGGKQQVIAGSVDQVSADLQAALGRTGVIVKATPEGQDVRLSGLTRNGKKFALLLKRQKEGGLENTAVSIVWEGEEDEQFWFTVIQLLMASHPRE